MALKTRSSARSSKSKRLVEVDMTDVGEGGGGGFHIPEGVYRMRCAEAKSGVSSNDNDQIEWIFKGMAGKAKGKTFYFYTPLVEQALWKLRETLVGLGVEVPESAMEIDLDELEGLEGDGVVEDDEYRGKIRSKLVGFSTEEAVEEEEAEAEARPRRTAAKTANGRAGKKLPKMDESEVKECNEEELEEIIEKYGIEDVDLSEFKTLSKKRTAVIAGLEEKGALG